MEMYDWLPGICANAVTSTLWQTVEQQLELEGAPNATVKSVAMIMHSATATSGSTRDLNLDKRKVPRTARLFEGLGLVCFSRKLAMLAGVPLACARNMPGAGPAN